MAFSRALPPDVFRCSARHAPALRQHNDDLGRRDPDDGERDDSDEPVDARHKCVGDDKYDRCPDDHAVDDTCDASTAGHTARDHTDRDGSAGYRTARDRTRRDNTASDDPGAGPDDARHHAGHNQFRFSDHHGDHVVRSLEYLEFDPGPLRRRP